MAAAGLTADIGVAAVAFVGTNVDNCVVTAAMVAGAPLDRAHRIAAGQVLGFCVIVAAAAAGAIVLFEFSPAVVGLLGLVPLAIGTRGLLGLRSRTAPAEAGDPRQKDEPAGAPSRLRQRAVGRSMTAAALVTIGAGGDNLAAYIPLFRVGGGTRIAAIAFVFVLGEAALTAVVLWAGRHRKARLALDKVGALAVPLLLCVIGVLVLIEAGTFSLL
ncbi:MAG TPA: cadmium resistance transporter [Acidimicrobiales bacterium]|nr:cadmium resistance transporter [Acidimicrobiales bacterium]